MLHKNLLTFIEACILLVVESSAARECSLSLLLNGLRAVLKVISWLTYTVPRMNHGKAPDRNIQRAFEQNKPIVVQGNYWS